MLRINGRASIRPALLLTVVFIISATVAAQQVDSTRPKDAEKVESAFNKKAEVSARPEIIL